MQVPVEILAKGSLSRSPLALSGYLVEMLAIPSYLYRANPAIPRNCTEQSLQSLGTCTVITATPPCVDRLEWKLYEWHDHVKDVVIRVVRSKWLQWKWYESYDHVQVDWEEGVWMEWSSQSGLSASGGSGMLKFKWFEWKRREWNNQVQVVRIKAVSVV